MAIRKTIRAFFSCQRAEKRFLSISQDSFDPFTLFGYEIKGNRFLALTKQISQFNITNLLSYCQCYNHHVLQLRTASSNCRDHRNKRKKGKVV